MAARFLEDVELGDLSVKESLAVHMAEEHLSVTKVGGLWACSGYKNTGSALVVQVPISSVTGVA